MVSKQITRGISLALSIFLMCAAIPVTLAQNTPDPTPTIESVPDDCHLISGAGTSGTVPDGFAVSKCLSTKGQRDSRFLPSDPAKNQDAMSTRSLLIDVIDIFVKVVATLSLIIFIIGALMTIVSQGKDDMIDRGKNTMIAAAIGLAIAMFSFIIVTFVQSLFFTS